MHMLRQRVLVLGWLPRKHEYQELSIYEKIKELKQMKICLSVCLFAQSFEMPLPLTNR